MRQLTGRYARGWKLALQLSWLLILAGTCCSCQSQALSRQHIVAFMLDGSTKLIPRWYAMILVISATIGCAKGGCRCVGGAVPAHLPIRPFSERAVTVRTLAINPLPRTLLCSSLKGRQRVLAERRQYLFVLGDVPSLCATKASIHLEEASCPADLRAHMSSEHSERLSTSL